jgi:hypothetical protein
MINVDQYSPGDLVQVIGSKWVEDGTYAINHIDSSVSHTSWGTTQVRILSPKGGFRGKDIRDTYQLAWYVESHCLFPAVMGMIDPMFSLEEITSYESR